MAGLGVLDVFIFIIVLIGLWRGFKAGLIQSIVSLVGWFLALVLGTRLAPVFAPNFVSMVESPVLQIGLAFLAIVLFVISLLHVVALILTKILEKLKLGILDKMAGGVLGAFRNILIVLVILSAISPVLLKTTLWNRSIFAKELLPYAPLAKTMMKEAFGQAWNQLDSNTQSITEAQPYNQIQTQ